MIPIDTSKFMLWLNDVWYSSFGYEESPTSIAIKEVMNTIEEHLDELAIVTCKDCKHRDIDGEITHYYWCRIHERPVDDTDYCSWGERREDDKE